MNINRMVRFCRVVQVFLVAAVFSTALLATFLAAAGKARADETDLPSGLRQLVTYALQNSQELQGMAEQVDAYRAEVPYAGALENPQLTLGLANLPVDTFDIDQEAMTQKQIFISQKIPWFGKLSLKEQIAELTAQKQQYLYHARQLELIKKLSVIWYDLAFIDYSLNINSQLAGKVNQMLRIAETRYSTGKGLQQDILAGQVQLSKILDEKISLKGKKEVLQAKIGELLNSDDPPVEEALHFDSSVIVQLPDRDILSANILKNNPALLAQIVDNEKAKLTVALAEKDYGSDMNFRIGYGQRDDDPVSGQDRADFFSASVTFSLPLWQKSRQDSQMAAAEKRQLSATKNVSSSVISLNHRLDQVLSSIEAAKENHELFKNALTLQADQLAEASLSAYSVGKVEFNTMLSARIQTLRYQLQTEKYRYQVLKKHAELLELTGEPASLVMGGQPSGEPSDSKEMDS